jgi:rubrerythrin
MPEVEEVLKDMAAFLSEMGHQAQFEEWLLRRGHDQEGVDNYNAVIDEL